MQLRNVAWKKKVFKTLVNDFENLFNKNKRNEKKIKKTIQNISLKLILKLKYVDVKNIYINYFHFYI